MPAPPALLEPAATLPGETDILAAVLADPSDDTAKLVYADWLEERDDPRGPILRNCVIAFRAGKPLPDVASLSKPWRDIVGISLLAKLQPLAATWANPVLRLARPALTFKSTPAADAELVTGATKLGGRPDLPQDMEWPVGELGPFDFIGQFNLGELATSVACQELPSTGLLSVFYDADGEVIESADRAGFGVYHFPDIRQLTRRDLPAGLDSPTGYRPCKVTLSETLTLPAWDSPWLDELPQTDDREPYMQLVEDPGLGHRILGHPHPLQNDVLGSRDMRHLLTVDSDDKPGWMWGDAGLLYFTISEENLKAHRFDRVRCEMQCC